MRGGCSEGGLPDAALSIKYLAYSGLRLQGLVVWKGPV